MQTIGFIGLGNLGFPIAANLLKAGYPLRVFNRTSEKSKPLADIGATVVSSPQEACVKDGIVITLVSDDKAITSIANNEFIKALGEGVHVSMSTIGADTSRMLAKTHGEKCAMYISAPVFARPEAAAARQGFVCMSGGTHDLRERVKEVLTAGVAKQIFDFGDDAGSAHVVKLIGNFMIASTIELLAESLTLAEKNGLAPNGVYDMLTSTLFASPVFQNYGRIILSRNFEPASFRLTLGLKDVNLVLENGRQSHTPLPLAQLVRDRMTKGIEAGKGDIDWASFSEEARKDAGL